MCKKILQKLRNLRKSCNHKWNINVIYNKKLPYKYLQQLLTLRLKTLDPKQWRNSDEKKWKAQTTAQCPVPPLKIKFYSYLAKDSQKATLNPYFKSTFPVKPSKFSIYLARGCSPNIPSTILVAWNRNGAAHL